MKPRSDTSTRPPVCIGTFTRRPSAVTTTATGRRSRPLYRPTLAVSEALLTRDRGPCVSGSLACLVERATTLTSPYRSGVRSTARSRAGPAGEGAGGTWRTRAGSGGGSPAAVGPRGVPSVDRTEAHRSAGSVMPFQTVTIAARWTAGRSKRTMDRRSADGWNAERSAGLGRRAKAPEWTRRTGVANDYGTPGGHRGCAATHDAEPSHTRTEHKTNGPSMRDGPFSSSTDAA
jgi:hypothetical protein